MKSRYGVPTLKVDLLSSTIPDSNGVRTYDPSSIGFVKKGTLTSGTGPPTPPHAALDVLDARRVDSSSPRHGRGTGSGLTSQVRPQSRRGVSPTRRGTVCTGPFGVRGLRLCVPLSQSLCPTHRLPRGGETPSDTGLGRVWSGSGRTPAVTTTGRVTGASTQNTRGDPLPRIFPRNTVLTLLHRTLSRRSGRYLVGIKDTICVGTLSHRNFSGRRLVTLRDKRGTEGAFGLQGFRLLNASLLEEGPEPAVRVPLDEDHAFVQTRPDASIPLPTLRLALSL